MNKADLVFDHNGKITQVCVARWPDGSQIWREIQGDHVFFEFRQKTSDSSTDYILSQVGLFPSFSIKDGHFHSMPGIRQEWNEMVPYVRWFSNELGFFRWPKTPMMSNEFSDVDPFVSWFVDLDAALSEARILDDKLFRVRAIMKDSPGTTAKNAAKEIGIDSDLVEQIEYFADSLLEPAWVFIDWSRLMGHGSLHFGLRRPNHSLSGGAFHPRNRSKIPYSDVMKGMEAPSLVGLVEMLSKLISPSAVLVFQNRAQADTWFGDHILRGSFTIPEEEIEVFNILDETLPYLLPNDEFLRWVMGRISI